MGRRVSCLCALAICVFSAAAFAKSAYRGTEVGNGYVVSQNEPRFTWTCFAQSQTWSDANAYVSLDADRKSQARNEAVDACAFQHPDDAEKCVPTACTFSAAN